MKSKLFVILTLCVSFVFAQSTENKKMEPSKIKIEVWSDVVCPFCLVGKKKLEQAINKLEAQNKIEIIWHSFQLDPDFPKETFMPSLEYLSERKGYPINQVKQMSAQLAVQGKEYGIDFQFEKALTFNTLNAHRLLQWSKTQNKSNELKEAFMVAYFTDGVDLSKPEKLLNVVESVGLSIEEGRKVLESDEFSIEVQNDIALSRQLGIRGVPYFLIDGDKAISGAQNDDVFEKAISKALKGLKNIENDMDEGVCLPTGECK